MQLRRYRDGHAFVGEQKINFKTALTTAAFSHWTFNHDYDVAVLTCLWIPTTMPSQGINPGTVAAQLVVEFNYEIYNYIPSNATANVQA